MHLPSTFHLQPKAGSQRIRVRIGMSVLQQSASEDFQEDTTNYLASWTWSEVLLEKLLVA
jgi:hypothetical protein